MRKTYDRSVSWRLLVWQPRRALTVNLRRCSVREPRRSFGYSASDAVDENRGASSNATAANWPARASPPQSGVLVARYWIHL